MHKHKDVGPMGKDHVKEYYNQPSDDMPSGHFHKVISLNDISYLQWEDIAAQCPSMPKGWYELSRLSKEDRVQFSCDYWMATLPYHPDLLESVTGFFSSIVDIRVYITQKLYDDPFAAQLVYILEGDRGFFKGCPPVAERSLDNLKKEFQDFAFPSDYIAFLHIHNGFAKSTDTGIILVEAMRETYQKFQDLLGNVAPLVTSKGTVIDPKTLLPFYESFGLPCFQCFWSEWYPDQEMGNLYYSDITKSISNCYCEQTLPEESMAFPTFSDWLMFYLEKIE